MTEDGRSGEGKGERLGDGLSDGLGRGRGGPQRALWALLLVLPLLVVALLSSRGPSASGPVVVLYTAMASEDVERLLPAFEAESGIRAEVVKLGSGDALQRLQAERERPACDVIFGVSPDQLEAHQDLFQPFTPAGAEALDPAFVGGARWTPWSALVLALIVNEERLPPGGAPRGWRDLADPRFAGQIVQARPDKSGSAYMHLAGALHLLGEEQGWPIVQAIARNARLAPGSAAVPRLVADGEAAVGLTLEDSAWRYVQGGGPVKLVHPSEGAPVAADGMALIAGAPHPTPGKAFLEWALSREAQTLLASAVGRRPVRRAVPAPSGLPSLQAAGAVPYPLAWSVAEQPRLLEAWRGLAGDPPPAVR